MCDEVEHATEYTFRINNGEDSTIGLGPFAENRISLEEYFNYSSNIKKDGFFDISVYARNGGADLTGFDNGSPQIIIYPESKEVVVSKAIQLKFIPAVQNVRIDYDNKTVYWEGVVEAETYEVTFLREEGGGHGRRGITDTQFQWDDDIFEYAEIVITAQCGFEITTENGVPLIFIPSKCSTPIVRN